MITTEQWRLSIDSFAGGKRSTPATSSDAVEIRTTCTTPRGWSTCIGGLLLLSSYSLCLIMMLLMCSGNVELNPGPKNCKKCPNCLTEIVPIKLKVCTCGCTFHPKSHRQPPKCNSIPIATLKLVTPHEEVVTDSDLVPSVEVQSQPIVTTKPGTSQKWEKYKDNINKKRRKNIC